MLWVGIMAFGLVGYRRIRMSWMGRGKWEGGKWLRRLVFCCGEGLLVYLDV